MGSQFHTAVFEGNLTKSEVVSRYNSLVEEERYEYGAGGYSGTFATLSGIRVLEEVFPSHQEAENYISENAEKWGSALAVRYRDVRDVFKAKPTFNGQNNGTISLDPQYLFNLFGTNQAKCVSTEIVKETFKRRFVFADQLTQDQKDRLKAALDPLAEENQRFSQLSTQLKELLAKLGNISEDFTAEDYKNLKNVRKELLKSKTRRDKLLAKFEALDERLGAKLWKKGSDDQGTKWLVAGWCSC